MKYWHKRVEVVNFFDLNQESKDIEWRDDNADELAFLIAKMTLQEFIDDNRDELDLMIRTAIDQPNFDLDDEERRVWIMNDEGLYNWALESGVEEI